MSRKNLFCRAEDLRNEADVEQIFARRLIEYIGYEDRQIRPKDSLTQLTVGGMRGTEALYRPDFAMKVGNLVRWIFEAKSPDEDLDRHLWQPRGYCTLLNGQYRTENPVRYFVLSNGFKTRLYQWDVNEPILELDFDEIDKPKKGFKKLISCLSPDNFARLQRTERDGDKHRLEKRSLEDVNAAFAWCHQEIYRKDNISQGAAFTEFVKVIFLKLLSDRILRDKYPHVVIEESVEVPADDVRFSTTWIENQERHTPNPLDSIQFRDFIKSMERDISTGRHKRIFDTNERINLTPETIRSVVGRIEHIYLFGIDADLNGRLFETFLNATMRGKDLGQYFTPRSIVKLGTRLALPKVHVLLSDGSWHTDIILDACCGTGGFLIDSLAAMWEKVNNNDSLDSARKEELRNKIANEHIYGIDVGREPPLARIARLNMYLHGDGGSSVFQADALDKGLKSSVTDSPELLAEKDELRELFKGNGFADIVLTNPPFAKKYERETAKEAQILDEYDIAINPGGDKRPSLRSNMMFIERYHDLLKVGGRMITVIDDGILSGRNYKWFREFIRQRFLIKGVVSLPGDAFQRSKARVKTSLF
jgi:type I restriction enzyme M protein